MYRLTNRFTIGSKPAQSTTRQQVDFNSARRLMRQTGYITEDSMPLARLPRNVAVPCFMASALTSTSDSTALGGEDRGDTGTGRRSVGRTRGAGWTSGARAIEAVTPLLVRLGAFLGDSAAPPKRHAHRM